MNRIKNVIEGLAARNEEGHAYAWGGGGLLTVLVIVLLIILIF